MPKAEEFVPNEYLRRARSLKGWSQADLAEQVGTTFEIVSRWERGIAIPSPYYRERLCAVLGMSAEELGLLGSHANIFSSLSSPLVFLASSHKDAEKPITSHLKTALQEQGIKLWSSRQLARQGNGNARITLREAVRAALVIVVIISPEAGSSRHIREALEMASRYQRPVCGIWIEGEDWERYLPEGHIDLAALIDAREKDAPVLREAIAKTLEQIRLASQNGTEVAQQSPPAPSQHALEPTNGARPMPIPTPAPIPGNRRGFSRVRADLLIGLMILVIAGGFLGSLSLLVHFGVLGTHRSTPVPPTRGGTWTDDVIYEPNSLIPNGDSGSPYASPTIDQALYLPLFFGDAQGVVYPGAASVVPTVQNGGISADGKTWTFHLRPHLVWSDGQPYDARDVDFTWKLWANPRFGAANPAGPNLISSASVSADHLTITFHLKQAYAPFLSGWVDGEFAPLPAHHFSSVAPDAILQSPENLNPQVVSGPFMMAESKPGDHFTLLRNPRYYLARERLPYLDRAVFRIVTDVNVFLEDLQAGGVDSAWGLNWFNLSELQRLTHYTLVSSPTSGFEAMYFNFHNQVLAGHLEVRQAMSMAMDQQALIQQARHGFASPLCTDHPNVLDLGNYPVFCPEFNPTAANKLLDDNGWVRGSNGVRAKGNQRLEFEYATTANNPWRLADEAILQRNFQAIGIKLDIQNYPAGLFFNSFLPDGKASPPTGAVAGRFDIAEFANNYYYDPDDSASFACDQVPPRGYNYGFYCNPALDALYKQELSTVDPDKRASIFGQIHQIYLAQLPFIALYATIDIGVVHKGTHNYQISPFSDEETVNIGEWWCDNGKC